ncbi:MAG: hypothetical protein JKY52_02700 [Flavobacteriales bacterium]|nr:hypothetical protein [Flavobacteriales bacterium]
MKILLTISVMLTSLGASASGMTGGKDDVVFSMLFVAFLVLILGMVYLADFVNKIRKDKDYRDHLKARATNLISTVRAVFVKEKKEDDDRPNDFYISVALE